MFQTRKRSMVCIRSGLASCDQHDFFKNSRDNAGFKAGNEPCFSFGAVWQAAIRMILQKHWGKCRFQNRKRAMLHIRSCLAICDQHDFFKNDREHVGFNTGNEPCFAFEVVWQAAISMISSNTLGKMLVPKQETSHASHSERFDKLRSAWFLQKH